MYFMKQETRNKDKEVCAQMGFFMDLHTDFSDDTCFHHKYQNLLYLPKAI